MKKRPPFIAALTVALAADAPSGWVQLIPAGTFDARDGRGPWTAGGRPQLDAILTATKAWLRGTQMPIDYDHQTLRAAENGKPAPAAGWVKDLEARDDGLWGLVEWTAAAAAAIKAGEYRYLSPVFNHASDGKITFLRMAAITNTPAADLAEVEALAALHPEPKDTIMDKILAALGLATGADETAALAAIAALKDGTSTVALAAGLKADAAAKDVALAVAAAVAAKPDPAKFVPIETVSALTTRIADLEKAAATGKVESAVTAALTAGRIIPAQKDWATAYAEKDLAGFQAFVATQPVIGGGQKPGKAAGGDGALDETDTAVLTALGLTPEAFAETRKKEAA